MSILSGFFESVSTDVAIACLIILFGLVYGSYKSSTALMPKKYITQIIVHPIKVTRPPPLSSNEPHYWNASVELSWHFGLGSTIYASGPRGSPIT
jgi:hypothetical protein